ncbi:MAG: RNA-binding protein [Lachnospiraceae bacterium]|nr:RNA-binding protein [Lachnospiraceae bacterium]
MELGKIQKLTVVKKVDFGVYLAEGRNKADDRVLLPKKQVPANTSVGDEIEVFIYRDSEDRMIATVNMPPLTLGGFAPLKVVEVTKIGAFLDWGLEKDLMLPYKQMRGRVEEGDEILVRLYIDKSDRLCASMKGLYQLLSTGSAYQEGDDATGRVYEFGHDYGTFIAIDDKYSAMIPRHEDTSNLRIGDVIDVRITKVKKDGKLDVTTRDKSYIQMDEDAAMLLELIDSYAGVLPFTEKASPDVIKRETGLSKNAFKRGIGRLYKQRLITIEDGKIRRVE